MVSDGATAVIFTGALSASESTQRTLAPTTNHPPAGPITLLTESYGTGEHWTKLGAVALTFPASRPGIPGPTPTGDGSLQLEATTTSAINHARTKMRCEVMSAPTTRRRIERSEERRVGKECRSRWSRYH